MGMWWECIFINQISLFYQLSWLLLAWVQWFVPAVCGFTCPAKAPIRSIFKFCYINTVVNLHESVSQCTYNASALHSECFFPLLPCLSATPCLPSPLYLLQLQCKMGHLPLLIRLSHNRAPVSQSTGHRATQDCPRRRNSTNKQPYIRRTPLLSLVLPYLIIWESDPCNHHPH